MQDEVFVCDEPGNLIMVYEVRFVAASPKNPQQTVGFG
jgi:hypothetical protein